MVSKLCRKIFKAYSSKAAIAQTLAPVNPDYQFLKLNRVFALTSFTHPQNCIFYKSSEKHFIVSYNLLHVVAQHSKIIWNVKFPTYSVLIL